MAALVSASACGDPSAARARNTPAAEVDAGGAPLVDAAPLVSDADAVDRTPDAPASDDATSLVDAKTLVPSSGCGLPNSLSGFTEKRTLTVGGETREYDLFIPPSYDPNKPLALVFVFHADSPFSIRPWFPIEQASNGQAIVVYPYGLGSWDLSKSATNYDYHFISELALSLKQSLCIDSQRVFAYGYSNGGFFANLMACFGPSVFRGIAVNGASIYAPTGQAVVYDDDGHPQCPSTAALVIHGTYDGYEGDYALGTWRAASHCAGTSKPANVNPCVDFDGCDKPVSFCPFNGGHEIWSSAAAASWSFFSKF